MKRLSFLVPVCLVVLLLLPAAAQAKLSFNQAIDKLFAQGYPQAVDNHLFLMPGTNPLLGFSWAGTWADDARANYLARQMRAIGLRNVHLEPVPVDVFTFEAASVRVGARTMVASTFAGIRPTPVRGLTAQVVYAHDGTVQDFIALQRAGVSIKGKLVLVDSNFQGWWLNYPAAEATHLGAIGLIMTYGPNSAPWYQVSPTALGSNDGEYTYSSAPMVYICKKDGDWLKQRLAGGHVTATMKLIERVRLAKNGGVGYNVIGDLPGSINDGTFVLYGAHHDVHFRAATDDSACVANNLAIAKAMVMSGYRPLHTVRFMFTTAEEFGYTDSWWDWSIGAWWTITHTHKDWAGRIRGFLNSDYFTGKGSKLALGTSAGLVPVLDSEAAHAHSLLPYGYAVNAPITTWQDGWTFTAAGVPSVLFSATPGTIGYQDPIYHTNYMRPRLVEWPYVAKIAKLIFRIDLRLDHGLLPYGLKAQADDLAATVVPADLKAAGASGTGVNRLEKAVVAFQKAAAQYRVRAASIPTSHYTKVNASLRQIYRMVGRSFTALNAWDSQIYPHEQVLADVQALNQAIADLQKAIPDTGDALTQLGNVSLTGYGLLLNHSVYVADLKRRDPHYYRADWGAQGHVIHYLDVIPQFNAIEAGTWNTATINQLKAMRALDISDLNTRLYNMTAALDWITPRVGTLH